MTSYSNSVKQRVLSHDGEDSGVESGILLEQEELPPLYVVEELGSQIPGEQAVQRERHDHQQR